MQYKLNVKRVALPVILPAILIAILSLAAFYTIDFSIFRQQAIFLLLSLVGYLVFLNVDYKFFGIYSKYVYYAMISLLLLPFLFGVEIRGAIRWIDFFGVRVQFSEIIKPFFVIFIASYLSSNDSRSLGRFLKTIFLTFPIAFLILRQPDLGNAMIYVFLSFFLLFIYGFPLRYFLGIGGAILVLLPFMFEFLAFYQQQRILTFINPISDPLSSSYNIVQSLISIGSGGLMGKGFGEGTQSILQFLPERHTDFIFATISENLGFLGGVLLIGLYLYMLLEIYKIKNFVSDDFSSLVLMGLYFLLLSHILINIGMNVGIVPIVGVTLPFASYGGSSLLTNFMILGIISSISFDFPRDQHLTIR